MSKRHLYTLGLLAAGLLAGCAEDDGGGGAEAAGDPALDERLREAIAAAGAGDPDSYRLPASTELDALPQDPRNPLTAEKVALGQLLFHETALGIDGDTPGLAGTFSCASCHHASGGFQANRWQGIGEGGVGFGRSGEGRTRAANVAPAQLDVQPLRSPSVLNAAYQEVMLWNGQFGATGPNVGTEAQWTEGTPKATNALGYQGVETQAIAGLKVHRLGVDRVLLDSFGYRARFDAAFPEWPGDDRYSRETAGLAIAAYERTVLADRAPFQRWLAGELAGLTDEQKRGGIVFFGDGDCAGCHSGPSLASMSFHALGLADLHDCPEPVFGAADGQAAHRGRGGFTMRGEDMFAFKTPQLYNLADSRFYGHGASLRSLREVVEYKNAGAPENERVPAERLSPEFRPLGLSEQQISDLVTFLETGLRDPDLARYEPAGLPSGQCFPNADVLSAADRGCR